MYQELKGFSKKVVNLMLIIQAKSYTLLQCRDLFRVD